MGTIVEYSRPTKDEIRSHFAYRVGEIVRQYRESTKPEDDQKYEATIYLLALQSLLTQCQSLYKNMYKDENMLIDPHTAVGIGVANKLSLDKKNVVLATAHPSKFPDVIKSETGSTAELPENLKIILDKKENYKKMPKDLENLKKYILEKI